ncbi:MAG: hypothetical protein R3C59_07785 [Planctomycetaceae bacterium]
MVSMNAAVGGVQIFQACEDAAGEVVIRGKANLDVAIQTAKQLEVMVVWS